MTYVNGFIEGLEKALRFVEDSGRDSTVYMGGPSEFQKGRQYQLNSSLRRIQVHLDYLKKTNNGT
jgi:hypothetical protein